MQRLLDYRGCSDNPERTNGVLVMDCLTDLIVLWNSRNFGFRTPEATRSSVEVCAAEDKCEKDQFESIEESYEVSDCVCLVLLTYAEAHARRELRTMVLSGLERGRESRGKQEKESREAVTKLTPPMETHFD
jgi:hypothetical protein